MAIQGLRNLSQFTVGGDRAQRPENWREGTLLLFPNGDTPLFGLSAAMREESTDDPKFHWFEKVFADQRIQMNEDLDAIETEITVVSGALQLKAGHILLVEHTQELIRVTSNPAVDTSIAVVVREYGGTTAGTVTIATENPFLTVVGSAYEEGSSAPSGIAYDPTDQFNYTQIFRNSLEMTETARRTRLRTGDQVREAKREALQYHNAEIERAAWFGVRAETTLGGRPLRLTEGFFRMMSRRASTRVVSGIGNLTYALLEGYLMEIFKYGSSEKMMFCGDLFARHLEGAIRKATNISVNIQSGQKEFGMNVTRISSIHGDLVMKVHPLFTRMTSVVGTYTSTDSWAAIMDMEHVRYRYLTARDTKFDPNQESPGDDQMKGGYLTECGFEFRFPESHYVLKGVTGSAAG